ncbi:MAG: sugar phosphate nucleotidyltransferase [Elusimicrobiota bacterium]|nr:sugar phosphate nucleotidyltransferase [Elusimicrobiales bacterium]HPO95831.1 sugar phosphate nucleotidyltransferase [Elusimicrobiales bacterium]
MSYTAIIPVAGTGTRLKPHTYTYPKVLLTVGEKPILGHIIDKLIYYGIKEICFVTGYLCEKVVDYVNSNYGKKIKIKYVFQEEQKGLGHAIWLCKNEVKGPVLIILGDTIIEADIKNFLDHKSAKIGINEVKDPQRFGIVKIEKGVITDMVEKPQNPPTNLAISGIYSFPDSQKLFKALDWVVESGKTTRGEIQLTDAMKHMLDEGYKIKPIKIDGWYDCGKPETLLATNKYILSKKHKKYSFKNSVVIDPVYISKTAKIKNSIIGPYVSVGDNALIEDSIISDSIINEYATIKKSNLVSSLIGPSATVVGKMNKLNVGENSEVKFTDEE